MRKKGQSVKANFGDRKFYFDFNKYFDENVEDVIEEILHCDIEEFKSIPPTMRKSKISINDFSIDPIILDYLVYNGYSHTYLEILSSTGQRFYSSEKIKERMEIRDLIKSKKFSEASVIIKNNFSNSSEFCMIFLFLCNKLWNILDSFLKFESFNNYNLLIQMRSNF